MSNDTRTTLEDLEISRFFFAPSFEVYGGVAGLYDFGPAGYSIERNLLKRWREHFVIEDDMVEVRCSALTPYKVLQSSGHTAKFADLMVTDTVNKQLYRADQLVESVLNQRIEKCKDPKEKAQMHHDLSLVSDLPKDDLDAMIEKYQIKSPDGNPLSKSVPFNLMFNTLIGPGDRAIPGFLRPETAQGIFVNFPRLFDFNRGKLPFACVQQGVSYRNEISPRNGLVRCREFMMAEIEHFADPEALDDFPKFETVQDLKIAFLSAQRQDESEDDEPEAVLMTLKEAHDQKIIPHRTIGYYIGRTYIFITDCGIKPEFIRFRQHRQNEKAHYARDCWDLEIKLPSCGWLECAGIADRQSFDLTRHAQATAKAGEKENPQMRVQVRLPTPIQQVKVSIIPNKAVLGKTFKAASKSITEAMENVSEEEAEKIFARYETAEKMIGGTPKKGKENEAISKLSPEDKAKFDELTTNEFAGQKLGYGMYTCKKETITIHNRSFIPNVIEPSFGVGRIITAILEHSFYLREGGLRRVLRLKPFIAPYNCVVLRLSSKLVPEKFATEVRHLLRRANLTHISDDSGVSIGKRYARTDELGIPFAITLDDKTVEDGTVTLRERDSLQQVRLSMQDAVKEVAAMTSGFESWEQIHDKYPAVNPPKDENE
ncbi:Glycine--tRNA ligase [Histomonas meleagridis]|uniref:Glycine--tRNA ligase n=1 Tax=Histomonas meleagridis TaxID=135588 RepID=UPI003559EF45|nr:Glycine--tRNA ligase [Histomonas meleagridis]KAH0802511.1 Glycine--tRNA ligase [Histomonas meleagridis]